MSSLASKSSYAQVGSDDIVPRLSVDLARDICLSEETCEWGDSSRVPSDCTRNDGGSAIGITLISGTISRVPQTHFDIQEHEPPRNVVSKSVLGNLKSWWLELTAMTTCIACLVAIAGILISYQNEPLSSWHFCYQPNAVLSQLMTVSRSTLMLSTASCIGQSSWLHIQQRPRTLFEIQAFDEASRGPVGAALMLTYASRYSLAALLGSVITISTLLMESFTQQVLEYPLRPATGETNATYPVTQFYAPVPDAESGGGGESSEIAQADLTEVLAFNIKGVNYSSEQDVVNNTLQAAVIDSLYGTPFASTFFCPTSSCSWQNSASLGVCSSCVKNLTADTEVKCTLQYGLSTRVCDFTTPGGFELEAQAFMTSEEERYETVLNTSTRTKANTSSSTIVSFASIVSPFSDIDITECNIYWCAKVYGNATMEGSSFNASVDSYGLVYQGYWLHDTPGSEVAYGVFEAEPGFPASLNSTFTLQAANEVSLTNFLRTVLDNGNLIDYWKSGPPESFTLAHAILLGNPSISDMAEKLAESLTNSIRKLPSAYSTQHPGRSIVQVTYIQVRWKWLIFPLSVVVLGLLLLIIMIYQSNQAGTLIWKTSPLALLFHPLKGWTDEELDLANAREVTRHANKMRGQLSYVQDTGYRIVRT